MKESNIVKVHEELKSGNLLVSEMITNYENTVRRFLNTNSIITQCNDKPKDFKVTDNLLSGCLYTLKDNVCTKGIRTTGGSKFLDDFIPPYSATVYKLLHNAGAILTSKANLDQFGMAGTGIQSAYGIVKNVLDNERMTGGSSSGSVNLVASKVINFAIGTDTGDSVRRPSSFLGVVGYIPSYGLVSRYGILPYAPSLDRVGVITRSVKDACIVADTICQFDPKDYTSQKMEHHFYQDLHALEKINVCVIKGMELNIREPERKIYLAALEAIRKAGHKIIEKEVNINVLNCIGTAYQVIANVEGLSCYHSFTGVPFGNTVGGDSYNDIILKNRNKYFINQVKKRIIMGAYVTSSENFEDIYVRSKKVRTLLVRLVKDLLTDVDCLLLPSSSQIAPFLKDAIADTIKSTHADDCLILSNFSGIPSITIPAGKYNNMPWGINLNCPQKQDQKLLNIAYTFENILGGKDD